MTDPRALAPYLGMIPPLPGSLLTYKPCTLLKPSKTSKESRWLLIWWQYSPKDGKVIRRRQGLDLASYSHLKEREKRAGEWMVVINSLLKLGYVYGEASSQEPSLVYSWEDLWEKFLSSHTHYSTWRLRGYTSVRKVWGKWVDQSGSTPASLTKQQGKQFSDFLKGLPSKKGTPYGAVTLNHYQSTLRPFGKWCMEQEYLTPEQFLFFTFKALKQPKSALHKPFTQPQLSQLLARAKDNPQLTLFLHLCYYTLARPRRELSRLRVGDIEATTLYIIPAHDKGRVGRRVLLPFPLQQVLGKYGVREKDPTLFLFTKKGVPGSKPVGHGYFYKLFHQLLVDLGWEGQNYTLYSLKSSGNIALWLQTQDLDLLRRQNGHSSLSMTERYLRGLGIILNQDKLLNFPVMGHPQ